jgi:hypothetical protein
MHGRSTEFVVVDDSDARTAEELTRRIVAELGGSAGQVIRYASRHDRLDYAEELAERAGVPPELVRHGLVGEAGAARNSALLDTLGTRYLQVDDDTTAAVFRPPALEMGVRLTSEGDANEHWYFPSLAEAMAAADTVRADPLALHEAVLGRSVGARCGCRRRSRRMHA